jgi:hypothetical protein
MDSRVLPPVPRWPNTPSVAAGWTPIDLLRICECVVTAVLGGLPPGSGPVVSGDSLRIWPRKRVPFI